MSGTTHRGASTSTERQSVLISIHPYGGHVMPVCRSEQDIRRTIEDRVGAEEIFRSAFSLFCCKNAGISAFKSSSCKEHLSEAVPTLQNALVSFVSAKG